MTRQLDLSLNGNGGIGKSYDRLLHHLGQPLQTAVGRLVLYKPFLATAAVWLDSAARRCELRLRFCLRKTCPALGAKQHSISVAKNLGKSFGTIVSQVDCSAEKESEEIVTRIRLNQVSPNGHRKRHFMYE
jgi:hypothetical protein